MKKLMLSLVLAFAAQAHADGFQCVTVEGDLVLDIYNSTDVFAGTRTPAVMIVSDPAHQYGNRTIARFTAGNQTLWSAYNDIGQYAVVGEVDLRYNDTGRAGEYISGTRLGEVAQLLVTIGFNYGDNLQDGEATYGDLLLVLRRGEIFERQLICTRYIKGM